MKKLPLHFWLLTSAYLIFLLDPTLFAEEQKGLEVSLRVSHRVHYLGQPIPAFLTIANKGTKDFIISKLSLDEAALRCRSVVIQQIKLKRREFPARFISPSVKSKIYKVGGEEVQGIPVEVISPGSFKIVAIDNILTSFSPLASGHYRLELAFVADAFSEYETDEVTGERFVRPDAEAEWMVVNQSSDFSFEMPKHSLVGAVEKLWKGLELFDRGEYSDAIDFFAGLRKEYPEDLCAASARYWMAECYERMGDNRRLPKEEQIKYYNKALEICEEFTAEGLPGRLQVFHTPASYKRHKIQDKLKRKSVAEMVKLSPPPAHQ